MNNVIENWKRDCEDFINSGGNEAMFWAGRLAIVSDIVIKSSTFSLSSNILFLKNILDIYNGIIEKNN